MESRRRLVASLPQVGSSRNRAVRGLSALLMLGVKVLEPVGFLLLLPLLCASKAQDITSCAGLLCQSALCCPNQFRSTRFHLSAGGPPRQGVLERLAAAVGVPLGGPGGGSSCASRAVAEAVVVSGRHRQLLQAAIGGIVRGSSRRQVRNPVCTMTCSRTVKFWAPLQHVAA